MNSALRQGMIPGQPQAMLSMGNPSFSVQNPVQLGTQQPLGPTSLGMPQNMQTNPPMTILSGGPVPAGAVPRYPLQATAMQGPLQQQQRPMVSRPPPNGSQLNPAMANASTSHIQSQPQTMPFPPNMMQSSLGGNNAIRRAPSQPQINMNSLPGMPASVTGNMSMGMNQQTTMPGQLRQVTGQQQNPHQLHQMRMQHQQQQQQQQMMPQSNIDLMIRNQVPGNMSARMAPTQGQVMSSLTQPPPLGSAPLPAGMPPSHQNAFNGSMPPASLSTSPRPTSTQGMPMGTSVSSHAPINRPRTSPDSSNPLPYMGYPASQFPGNTGRGIPPSPSSSSYPFVPATSPPMQLSDIPQASPPGMMPSQSGNPANKGFFPTPAQQHLDMTGADMYNPVFSMPPSISSQLPSVVPLQQPPLPSTPQTPALSNSQQHRPPQPSPSPQQQVHQHQVGHQIPPDQIHGLSQGPHSQPHLPQSQGVGGTPGGSPSTSQLPRGIQPPTSSNVFAGGLTAAGRLPLSHQTQGPSLPSPSQSTQQQQSQTVITSSRPSIGGSATIPHLPTASSNVPSVPVSTTSPPPGIGIEQASSRGKTASGGSSTYYNNQQEKQGLGLMRLLQFSGTLSNESPQKHHLSYWNDLIREYFTPRAIMRLTLWKDNQRIEAKPFEIGVPILPRFFLVTTQSGVKSMTFSLDSARERIYQSGHTIVECLGASWTYRYRNGYTVTLRGPLTAHVIATSRSPPGSNTGNNSDFMYKFDEFQFDANFHDKYIALESILGARSIENLPPPTPMMMTAPSPSVQTAVGIGIANQGSNQQQADDERKWEEPRVLIDHASLPGEPVNAFGIPQATMRCLELAESVTSMAELIQFAKESSHGPLGMNVTDALKEFALRLRESGAVLPSQLPTQPPLHGHPMNINFPFYQAPPSAASSGTLYSGSASPSTTHSMPPGSTPISTATVSSPPNTTPSGVNSPEKQPPKPIPQSQQSQQAQTSSAPTTSPAMSTTSTPAAGIQKRKQTGDATSPTIGNEQQPQKRMARKRVRTGTG